MQKREGANNSVQAATTSMMSLRGKIDKFIVAKELSHIFPNASTIKTGREEAIALVRSLYSIKIPHQGSREKITDALGLFRVCVSGGYEILLNAGLDKNEAIYELVGLAKAHAGEKRGDMRQAQVVFDVAGLVLEKSGKDYLVFHGACIAIADAQFKAGLKDDARRTIGWVGSAFLDYAHHNWPKDKQAQENKQALVNQLGHEILKTAAEFGMKSGWLAHVGRACQ